MKKIFLVVSGVIVNQEKRFLLTKRVDQKHSEINNKWQIPGGGLEFGETPEITLKRELKEELSVEVEVIQLIPKIFTEVFGNYQLVFINYLCRLKDNQGKIILNEEASQYGWFSLEEVKKLSCLSKVREVIDLANQML